MADKGKKKRIDSDSKVYCNEKQWACGKYPYWIDEIDFVCTHTFISTQFSACKNISTCTRSHVHAWSCGGFTFPGMPTILMLLYRQVNKRVCSQTLLPVSVAMLLCTGWKGGNLNLEFYRYTPSGQGKTLSLTQPSCFLTWMTSCKVLSVKTSLNLFGWFLI